MKKTIATLLTLAMLLMAVSSAEGREWACPGCGETNAGNFCGNCGTARPVDKNWQCVNCGETNAGNFCGNCGTARPKTGLPDADALYRAGEAAFEQGAYLTAVGCLNRAAKAGSALAQFRLGWMYANGLAVEQSWEAAAKYYRQAADQGIAAAVNNLGILYELGQGVEQSLETAMACYQQAAEAGLESGKGNVQRLTNAMSQSVAAAKATAAPKATNAPKATDAPKPTRKTGSSSIFSSSTLNGLSYTGLSFSDSGSVMDDLMNAIRFDSLSDSYYSLDGGSSGDNTIPCISCKTTGRCSLCDSNGKVWGMFGQKVSCTACGGSKKCTVCGGDGYI